MNRLTGDQRGTGQRRALVLAVVVIVVLVGGCAGEGARGTAWGSGSFETNGERIYFTGTSDSGDVIDYTGGPGAGAMMTSGRLTCASCHGVDARGGTHRMHMDVMDAPNIRWVVLAGEAEHGDESGAGEDGHGGGYDPDAFRLAVVDGVHGDGEDLSEDMPRWVMSERDLRDLAGYLQSFATP